VVADGPRDKVLAAISGAAAHSDQKKGD